MKLYVSLRHFDFFSLAKDSILRLFQISSFNFFVFIHSCFLICIFIIIVLYPVFAFIFVFQSVFVFIFVFRSVFLSDILIFSWAKDSISMSSTVCQIYTFPANFHLIPRVKFISYKIFTWYQPFSAEDKRERTQRD